MSRSWRILLPFSKPMSLNHRQHWRVKAKVTAEIREAAALVIRQARVPELVHLRAWVEYAPRDKRRRDPINLVPTLKACEDALVDCGVVPDDTPDYVESVMPKILPKSTAGVGQLWLVVEEACDVRETA